MFIKQPTCEFAFFRTNCECDPIDEPWIPEAVKDYYEAPENALSRACGCNEELADVKMLQVIATVILQNTGDRSERLARQLIKMILEGYIIPSRGDCEDGDDDGEDPAFRLQRCHWELPLIGLLNMLVAIRRDGKSEPDDVIIGGLICAEYKKILDVVTKDLLKLLPAGAHADHMRNTVVKTLAILADDKSFRNTLMHDSKAMELILTCWTHMSTPNRGDVSALIHSLYMDQCGCRPCYVDPASDRHARAVHIIGVDTLIGKFEDWLTDLRTLDEALLLELYTLEDFISDYPPYGEDFTAAKIWRDVVKAMQRQKEYGDPKQSRDIYDLGFSIFGLLTADRDYKVWDEPMELPAGTIELAATALFLDCDTREDIPAPHVCPRHGGWQTLESCGYFQFLKDVQHSFEGCKAGRDCNRSTMEQFRDALRAEFEKVYIPVNRALLVKTFEGNAFAEEVSGAWNKIAKAMKISEATVYAKWVEEGECCNPWCPNRGVKTMKRKRCARCQVVRYCSSDCQKAHWREHKVMCRQVQQLRGQGSGDSS